VDGLLSVSATTSKSGTLVFLFWSNLSGSISIVVVSSCQPSKARLLVPTDVILWKNFTFPFFPDAIVVIARFLHG